MKFQAEKKSTLCIYTEEGYASDKMDREVTALRRELTETRQALRTQTARCRQLVVAFTARLRQKEQEERQGREFRDQQLSTVLRALLVLEARLRREQRAIQRQLQERDAVIRSQTLEIARLRRATRSVPKHQQVDEEHSARKAHKSYQKQDDDIRSEDNRNTNSAEDKTTNTQQDTQLDRYGKIGIEDHGVQQMVRKLERERGVKFDEDSIKQTSSHRSKRDTTFDETEMSTCTKQSFENLDSNHSGSPVKDSSQNVCSTRNIPVNGLSECLQDNIDSETSESTVVELRAFEEYHLNSEAHSKCGGKRFIKHQGLKSEGTINRLRCNRQKEVVSSDKEEFVSTFECEDPELTHDSDSGVFQGSSTEGSDTSLKSDCQDNSYQDQDDDMPNRDLYKDYQHNPVLECVNQILLRDQDDLDSSAYRSPSDDSDKMEDMKKIRFNNLWPSIQEEQESQDEEEDTGANTGIHPAVTEHDIKKEEVEKEVDNEPENKSDLKKIPSKEKIPSPPIKAQHLEEKACLLMSSQRLTLVRNLELEEVDKKEENDSSHKVSYQKAKAVALPTGRSSVPPALPPKPPQLGSMCRLRHKKNIFLAQMNQSPHPIHSNGTTSHHPKLPHKNVTTENNREVGENNLDTIAKGKPPHPCDIHMHYSHPVYQEKPRQRQILSNGSLKRALSHESQETRQFPHEHQEKTNTSKTLEEKLEELNLSAYRHPVKVVGPVAARVQRQLDNRPALHDAGRHQYLKEGLVEDQSGKPASSPHGSNCGAIRVGSSVSSLITGSTGGSIVTELTQGAAAVDVDQSHEDTLQHSKDTDNDGDEDGNATLRSNFEEFRLEDVDMDSVEEVGRPAGDGAEARTAQVSQNGGSYEHFLEATGLSQKSIMTPSRMFSNHRSVIKPKDVKHRSRVLKAAAVNERCGSVGGGPIVKYWVEPFL